MKITDVTTKTFRYISNTVRDAEGHGHPGDPHEATQTLLTIHTDEGVEGHSFGADPNIVDTVLKDILIGQDPLLIEKHWQSMKHWQRLIRKFTDSDVSHADLALWDLKGKVYGDPVYKILGGYRDKVLAYASTMCGDELKGGLSTPEEYADFADWAMKRGYKAFKLHTWQPPIEWAPDPKMDVAACAAVREAVGPDIPLMLDCYHYYSRLDSLYIGRGLEKLNYHWFEEPMDEHSISSYEWLAKNLDIPVIGPETAEGKFHTRAEWIKRDIVDISRGGVGDIGGITAMMKLVHLCESFEIAMEVHGGGSGNLHVLGAMGIPGEFYERGLLHPFIDYDEVEPWLNSKIDDLDDEGYVHMPQTPGLGEDINFDYIDDNIVG
ncbi:MAG: enolase [Chloroflexi bacterium]|nr:enolase [Chloroflexota bacterium]|tara:strand:- start:2941 stop:4077 length:1137 start_codon:yes stop_codon:yes gene_type:complete